MFYAKDLPASGMTFSYTYGEVLEFIEEVAKADIDGMLSELCDVYTCATCAIENYTGINLPIIWNRSANVWMERVHFYTDLLDKLGLEFKTEYLRFGSNPEKPEKIKKIIELAREDQA